MSLFRKKDDKAPAEPAGVPELPSEDTLKFQLREAERTVSALEGDLERARAELGVAQRRSGGADELARAIGQSLAHLATQVALVQDGSDALDAGDLATTASGLLKALAGQGVATEGEVGSPVPFDPNRHLALNGSPAVGDRVIVRSPAVAAPSGQIVRHATVEPA